MEKYFLSCDPPICIHPAEEGFANLGFKSFLCGLIAYLRALCVQLHFVGLYRELSLHHTGENAEKKSRSNDRLLE